MNSNVNPNILICVAGALLALILGGLFMLTWHGVITGGEALALVGSIVTALLAIFATHSGVGAGVKAARQAPAKSTTHSGLPE